ncbi:MULTISPECIES: hypothetical protein [Bacillus]|uniref:hypothetical protein n=1 Tax=Bacillus TaxID=1386 RepID=UPI0003E2C15A|nr:hypothetical protein [Bacillus cereus]ETT76197.1 hypothetical protein C175_19062 [Bacillus cereus]
MINKKHWVRADVLGCNNQIWINGNSGAVYHSKRDSKRWMWRNNIINANSVDDVEDIMRLLELGPTNQKRMFLYLIKK